MPCGIFQTVSALYPRSVMIFKWSVWLAHRPVFTAAVLHNPEINSPLIYHLTKADLSVFKCFSVGTYCGEPGWAESLPEAALTLIVAAHCPSLCRKPQAGAPTTNRMAACCYALLSSHLFHTYREDSPTRSIPRREQPISFPRALRLAPARAEKIGCSRRSRLRVGESPR